MNRIAEFYESNHLFIFTILFVAALLIIFNKNQQIKKLISKVAEMKVKITEIEAIRIKQISKTIKLGSLVRLKYVLTGEIINILISENENIKFKNNSDINRINVKTPLAIALLDMEEGDTIKFKKNLLDDVEVFVLILDVNNGFNSNTETVIFENNDIETNINFENLKKNLESSTKDIKHDRLNGEELFLSYFILDENWYGQNKTITVTFIGGNYDGRIFNYNHDEVYIGTIEHYETLDSWKDYGRFSNSRNIPEIAQKYVTEIIK
jgi:transcription elongation GreA/GreB family factor